MLFRLMLFTLGWTLIDGSEMEQDLMWHVRKIPWLVSEKGIFHLTSPAFEADAKMVLNRVCGIECQKALPAPSLSDLEDSLSYERRVREWEPTLDPWVSARLGPWANSKPHLTRSTREEKETGTVPTAGSASWTRNSWPISLSRRWSSPQAAAHSHLSQPRPNRCPLCPRWKRLHQRQQKLRAGLLKMRNKRGWQETSGSRRNRRKWVEVGREGAKTVRRRQPRPEGGERGLLGVRELQTGGSFQWTRSRTPTSPRAGLEERVETWPWLWLRLLELKRPHKKKYMDLGVSPTIKKPSPVGWSTSQLHQGQGRSVKVYRFCSVSDESNDLLYQYWVCRIRLHWLRGLSAFERARQKRWKRKIIAWSILATSGWTCMVFRRTTTWPCASRPQVCPDLPLDAWGWCQLYLLPIDTWNEVADHPDMAAVKAVLIYCSEDHFIGFARTWILSVAFQHF